MKKLIKLLAMVMALVMALSLLTGCGDAPDKDTDAPQESAAVQDTQDGGKNNAPADKQGADKDTGKTGAKPEASQSPEAIPQPTANTEPTQTASAGSADNGSAQTGTAQQTGGGWHHSDAHHEDPHHNEGGANQNTAAEHTHQWTPVYKTVHHDEVGHYETVVIQAAWDEEETIGCSVCSVCGASFGSASDAGNHVFDAHDGAGGYYSAQVPTGNTIHHDEVTEQQWVIDTAAYDEQVIDCYTCSCGLQKAA